MGANVFFWKHFSLDCICIQCHNVCVEYVSLRVLKETQRKLKLVAALLETSMLEVLDRLVTQELERIQEGNQNAPHEKDQTERD